MKKLYAFLLMMLLALSGLSVSAASFTLKVEGSGTATLYDANDTWVKDLEAGQTYNVTFSGSNKKYQIYPDDNVTIKSVDSSYGDSGTSGISGSYSFTAWSYDEWTVVLESSGTVVDPPVDEGTLFKVNDGGAARLMKYSYTSYEYEQVKELITGDNKIKLGDSFDDEYCIYANNGQVLKSVSADGKPMNLKNNGTENYVEFYGDELAAVYEIVTEPQQMYFTVNIDDPDGVNIMVNYSRVSLVTGENKVPITQSPTDIIMTWSVKPYYVKLNGVAKNIPNNNLMFEVNKDDVLDIQCKTSGLPHTYKFIYEGEANSEFWTRVTVDGVDADFSNGTFQAKAGEEVALWNAKASDWDVFSCSLPDGKTLSGDPIVFSENYPVKFIATDEDGEIKVNAKPSAKHQVTFNITGAEFISVYMGSIVSGRPISGLVEGPQTVELSNSQMKSLCVTLKNDDKGYIRSVRYTRAPGQDEIESIYSRMQEYYPVTNLEEGATVNIMALAEPGTFDIIVNVNNPDDIKLWASNMDAPVEIPFEFKAGENIVPFPEQMIQLYIRPSKADSFINSVKYRKSIEEDASAAVEAEAEGTGFYVNFPKAGYVLDVDAGHVIYEDRSLIYVDNAKAVLAGVLIETKAGRSVKLNTGYNEFMFNEDENGEEGFTIRLQGSGSLAVFVNNEPVEKDFAEATSATFVMAPSDIVKVYVENEDPKMINLDFSAESTNELELPVAVNIVEIDLAETEPLAAIPSFSALPGTRVRFKVEFDNATDESKPTLESFKVMMADGELAADETDGIYTIDMPSADAAVNVVYTPKSDNVGITVISRDSDFSDAVYFDLQGRRIERPAAGLYIRVSGTEAGKVLVK